MAPVSVNAMYMCVGRRIILTKAARNFKRDVAEQLKRFAPQRITGDVSLKLVFMWKDRRRRDVDNFLKCVIDSLKDILFGDDSVIQKISARKIIGGESTSIGICVAPC